MKKLIKLLLAAIFGSAAAWVISIKPRIKNKPDMTRFPDYDYAKGGLADFIERRPENSLSAYRAALDNGYGISIDVRLTRDGVPAAFSDHDLWRMCGAGSTIEETKWDDIRKMKLQETDEAPVSLEEALHFIDAKVPVILNLKSWRDNYGSLCSCVSSVLETYNGYYVIQSDDSKVLCWFRKYMNEAVRGRLLIEKAPSARSLPDFLSCLVNNLMLTNIFTAPDYIAVDYQKRDNISLRLCRLIYHIPVVYQSICSDDDYEAAREADATVIFEEIEP